MVANQYPVLDVSATAFSRYFYWALAMGHSIGDAAREARVSVNHSISGEAIDWAVPVVFARNPANIFACQGRRPNTNGRSAAVRSRRRAVENRTRIGIWNAHRMIPHLPDICERLTKHKRSMPLNPFPAPIGTWRRNRRRIRHSWWRKRCTTLENETEGVGRRATDLHDQFSVKDARTSYLYYWRRDPLIVTSTFELLEQLNEQDYTVERMMAHLAAAVVAGIPHTHVGLGRPIALFTTKAGYSVDRRAAHVLCELP